MAYAHDTRKTSRGAALGAALMSTMVIGAVNAQASSFNSQAAQPVPAFQGVGEAGRIIPSGAQDAHAGTEFSNGAVVMTMRTGALMATGVISKTNYFVVAGDGDEMGSVPMATFRGQGTGIAVLPGAQADYKVSVLTDPMNLSPDSHMGDIRLTAKQGAENSYKLVGFQAVYFAGKDSEVTDKLKLAGSALTTTLGGKLGKPVPVSALFNSVWDKLPKVEQCAEAAVVAKAPEVNAQLMHIPMKDRAAASAAIMDKVRKGCKV